MKFHWFRRPQREEELDAEIRSHLDEAIRDRFGNVGLVKEVTRDVTRYPLTQLNASSPGFS